MSSATMMRMLGRVGSAADEVITAERRTASGRVKRGTGFMMDLSCYFFRATVTRNAPHNPLPSASAKSALSFVLPLGRVAVSVAPVAFGSAFVSALTPAISTVAWAIVGKVRVATFLPGDLSRGSYR